MCDWLIEFGYVFFLFMGDKSEQQQSCRVLLGLSGNNSKFAVRWLAAQILAVKSIF